MQKLGFEYTGETGVVKSFHEDENGYVYGVLLGGGPVCSLRKRRNDPEAIRPGHIRCAR
jgi:hypothetical protein